MRSYHPILRAASKGSALVLRAASRGSARGELLPDASARHHPIIGFMHSTAGRQTGR